MFVGVAALELVALALGSWRWRARFARSRRSRGSRASPSCTRRRSTAVTSCMRTLVASASAAATRRTLADLLVAGLYNEAQVQRKAGKGEDANRLIQMLVERKPSDVTTRLLWAESLLLDRKDPAATLAVLDSITVRPDDARLRPRRDMLAADALASGRSHGQRAGRTPGARDAVPGESAHQGEAGFDQVDRESGIGNRESRTLGMLAVSRPTPDEWQLPSGSLFPIPYSRFPIYCTISANPRCFARTIVAEPFAGALDRAPRVLDLGVTRDRSCCPSCTCYRRTPSR